LHDKGDNEIQDVDEVEILQTALAASDSTGGAGVVESEPAELWAVSSAHMLEPFTGHIRRGALAFAEAAHIVEKEACEIHDGDKLRFADEGKPSRSMNPSVDLNGERIAARHGLLISQIRLKRRLQL